MNICFVFKEYPIVDNSSITGVGNYMRNLAQKLSRNHSVIVLTQTRDAMVIKQRKVTAYSLKRLALPSIIQKKIIFLLLYNIRVAWNLLRLHAKHHFDVIEFANWEVEGLLFALICLLFRIRIKIICRLHTGTYDVEYYYNNISFSIRVIDFMECCFVNLPNVYLTTSTKAHARHSRIKYHIANKKISIIPLGVLQHNFPIEKGKEIATTHESKIVFVGRIEKRKGISTLVEAIPYVHNQHPYAVFYIIGDGSSIDIFSLIHKFIPVDFLSRVRYQGYIASQARLNYFYKSAEICIFPSLYESFGLTIIEAMSYAKPIIASRIGGIPEIITHGVNGILIPPGRPKILANAINMLLVDTKLCKRLSIAALSTIEKRFSLDQMYRKTEAFYAK